MQAKKGWESPSSGRRRGGAVRSKSDIYSLVLNMILKKVLLLVCTPNYSFMAFFFMDPDPDFLPIRIRTKQKNPIRIRTKGPGSKTLGSRAGQTDKLLVSRQATTWLPQHSNLFGNNVTIF